MVRLARLRPGKAALLGPGRLLQAADAAELAEAADVLREARREANAVRASALAEADAVREAARAEGVAAAAAEVQDRLFEIAEASISVIARTEDRIVALALQIAERVVGSMDGQEVAARVALRTLRLGGRSAFLRLRVAPGSADGLRERLEAMLPASISPSAFEVVPDPRVQDSGCIMETDAGLVDATIESQLDAIRRGLERSLARAPG